MTQQDIADTLKVTRSAVGEWEQGRNKPTADTLERLADVLKTDVNYLLGTETEKPSELERKIIQAGLKDKINKLSPNQIQMIVNIVDNLDTNKNN